MAFSLGLSLSTSVELDRLRAVNALGSQRGKHGGDDGRLNERRNRNGSDRA
jgi:hypothetical protein